MRTIGRTHGNCSRGPYADRPTGESDRNDDSDEARWGQDTRPRGMAVGTKADRDRGRDVLQ